MRAIQFILMFLLGSGGMAFSAFTAPVGIPDPVSRWGMFDPIRSAKPDTKIHCPGWHEPTPRANSRATGDARDAYYIDNTHTAATDSSNPFGSPAKPRKTFINKIYSAGDYIEIHGDGNPTALASPYTGTFNPMGVGTDAAPIWFVGVNQPVFTGTLALGFSDAPRRSYMVFDGVQWRNGGTVDIRPKYTNNSIDHIAFRNCLLKGREASEDGTGFTVGATTTIDSTRTISDVVFYDGEVSHYGSKNAPGEECNFYVTTFVSYFWILDSDIHDAAEDGMQFSHGGQRKSNHLFVGRNNIYNNLTDPIDVKATGDCVVFSQNNIYGHYDVWPEFSSGELRVGQWYKWKSVSGSPDFSNVGAGVGPYVIGQSFTATGTIPQSWGGATVHYQASTGSGAGSAFHYSGQSSGPTMWQNFPEDISFICNTVRDGRNSVGTSICGRLRVVGNTFRNTRHQPSGYTDVPYCIDLRGIQDDTWISHNTIYDCQGAIRIWDVLPEAWSATKVYYLGYRASYDGKLYVLHTADDANAGQTGTIPTNAAYWKEVRIQINGNIIANTFGDMPDIHFNNDKLVTTAVDSGSNCVYNPAPGGAKLINLSLGGTDLSSNPILKNPTGGDFSLTKGSPAVDMASEGVKITAYADFQSRFGIDIRRDLEGNPRSVGGNWDAGAYELQAKLPSPGDPKVDILQPKSTE